ncbi:MAG: hypothetical protein CL677_06380 [Bdellovibrionaceae bacterium]|nr:hypothetical protein [Pseudobdellovibrionaceae bacterium]|tara:strand:- start:67229 stop:67459 length:231 start_codon:yes stop_codon:yes gene_type:complete
MKIAKRVFLVRSFERWGVWGLATNKQKKGRSPPDRRFFLGSRVPESILANTKCTKNRQKKKATKQTKQQTKPRKKT